MPVFHDISIDDVIDAARKISPHAIRTPLLENEELNRRCGRRVLIKFEGAQRTGSFKFRGACNRLVRLDRPAEVVAWSGGNHAQGIASVARMLGIPATIVMPSDAPLIKLANVRSLGARVITYDRTHEDRETIARTLTERQGAIVVPSFDDPFVIAGQGTVGLELIQQALEIGIEVAQVLVPCGGGGLAAGMAIAINGNSPTTQVYIVEPAGFDKTARSLVSGRLEHSKPGAKSICDALLAPTPGKLTLPINHSLLAGGLVVSDEMVRDAMRFAFRSLKLVVEPGGAVALAAMLQGLAPPTEGATALVLSGSNVDRATFVSILAMA